MKNRMRWRGKLQKEQSGMVVVEALLSFTVFMRVVMAIVYLMTIHIVHNRIQFAINSAAHELASYSYVYQALGLREAEQAVQADGQPYTQKIDDTADQVVDSINQIQNLYSDGTELQSSLQEIEVSKESLTNIYDQAKKTGEDAKTTADSVKESAGKVTGLLENPNDTLVGMIYMGASGASYYVKSVGAAAAARGLTQKYLGDKNGDANAYLIANGVAGGYSSLDFSGSTMFCDPDKKLIYFVVQYEIDMSFLSVVLPGDKMLVVQRVTVPAWLDGDGQSAADYLGK